MAKSNLLESLMGAAKTSAAAETTEETTVQAAVVEIEDNELYNIISNEVMADTQIIEQLTEILQRDPNLTKEENLERVKAFEQLNEHYQNQIIQLANQLAEFSNDEALSFYDEVVEQLQGQLQNFASNIQPLVHSLQVIKEADANGTSVHELLERVINMRNRREEIDAILVKSNRDLNITDKKVSGLKQKIESHTKDSESAEDNLGDLRSDLSKAKGKLKEASSGLFSFLNGSAKKQYASQIEDLEEDIARQERRITSNDRAIASAKSDLTAAENKLTEQSDAINELETELKGLTDQLEGDRDIHAVAKLTEITGAEYKDKRGDLVGNAKSFIETAIKEFESCINRFHDLESEVEQFSNVAENVINNYYLLIKGSEEAYKTTDADLKSNEASRDELAETEADSSVPSPEMERLNIQVRDSKDFLNKFLPNQSSAINFRRIVSERQAEFTGLQGMIQGKRMDAQELRTNGAVAVASQLVMTLKSLEAAIAGEKTDVLRGMLNSFSNIAKEATNDVLDRLTTDQDNRNERLVEALQGLVEMKSKLDSATDELLQSHTDRAGLTEATIVATDRINEAAENLKNTVTDGAREGKSAVTPEIANGIVDNLENNSK